MFAKANPVRLHSPLQYVRDFMKGPMKSVFPKTEFIEVGSGLVEACSRLSRLNQRSHELSGQRATSNLIKHTNIHT